MRRGRWLLGLTTLLAALGIAAASAVASGGSSKPRIVSATVTHIHVQGATLRAVINPGSNETTWEVLLEARPLQGL